MKKQFQSKSVPRGTRTIWRYLGALFILFTFAIGNVWAADTVFKCKLNGSVVQERNDGNSGDFFSFSFSSGSFGWKGGSDVTGCTYDGVDYTSAMKFDSKPTLSFTTTESATVIVVQSTSKNNSKAPKFDGTAMTSKTTITGANVWTITDVDAGSHNVRYSSEIWIHCVYVIYPDAGGGGGGGDPVDPEFTYTPATYVIGDPALDLSTKLSSTNTTGAITFAIKDAAGTGASIANSKNFTATTAGTAKVTVSQEASTGYNAKSQDIDVTVAAPDPCTTHFYFYNEADQTSNGKTNSSIFTNTSSGSSNMNGSITIDGTTYNTTRRSGDPSSFANFTIPANKAGTFYALAVSSGDGARKVVLTNSTNSKTYEFDVPGGSSAYTTVTIPNLPTGSYSVGKSGGNTRLGMMALKVCDAEYHTITLDLDGGTGATSIQALDGVPATKPDDPTRGKYTFLGWFVGDTDTEYDWTDAVDGDITLKAHWQDPWTITFNSDGGSEVSDITVKHNTKAEKPTDPTKASNEFEGWFIGDTDNEFDWDANVTANYSLKAHWLAVVAKYDIEYYDGETKIGTEAQVRVDQHPTAAGIETSKSLYHFDGWFLSSALTGDPVNLNTVTPSEGLKIYGKWTKTYGSSLDFAAVTTAGTTASNPIATFLASGNMAATGLTESLWETSTGKSGFIGYKLKDAGAQIKFNLQAGKRAIITLGNVADAVNINAGGEASVVAAAAGNDAETVVPAILASTEDILVTLTTTTKGTVTLKSILIEDIPALDNDHTLKDLKVGGVPVAGFSAGTGTYYYEVPYGTEDFPVISATANSTKALQVAIQQAVWADAPYNCYRAQANVQAQDGSWGYYDVRFYFAPKYGVELIKATHTGEHTADKAGYWKDDVTIDKNTQDGGKLGSADHYFGFTLGNGKKFQAGDLVVIKASAISSTVELFDKKTFSTDQADSLTYLNKGNFDSHSKMYTFTLTADADKLYLYRTKTANSQMNPTVDYIAVYRYMAPFIESFKIGEVAGTISGTNIAIELPYGTSLYGVAATIEAYANGGATVIAPTPLAYDTPLGYKVSSAYAEDGDVDYTVTITEAEASHEATLSDIKLDGVSLAGFDPATLRYNVELEKGTLAYPTVTYTAATGATVVPNSETFPGAYNLVVTAEDGSTTQTYTINFTVSTKIKVVIYNGNAESAEAALKASPDVTTGASWSLVGSLTNGEKELAPYHYSILTNGSTSDTKHIAVTTPENYIPYFEIVQVTNSNNKDRRAFVALKKKASEVGETDSLLVVASSDIYTPVRGMSGALEEGKTYYIHATNSINFFEINLYLEPIPAKCEQPTITSQPATKTDFGAGNMTATVVAEVSDGGTLKYQWYNASDDSEVTGQTTATLTTAEEGTYYVIVTNTLDDHRDNSIKSDEAQLAHRALDDATLSALSYGTPATAIALVADKYEYRVDLAMGTIDVPELTATATMAPYPTVAITNATEFVNYEATSTVLVTAEDGVTQKTYTVKFVVDHIYTALVDVTGSTTWNWTGSEEATINDVANKGLILANYIDGLNFEKIEGKEGERARRDQNDGVYQGTHLHFNTTVPGKVKFYFRAPSSGEECVITVINNGKEIRVDSTGNSFKWSREVVVYGDVVIEMENKKEGKTDTRVQQIVFTEASPNYSRDVTNNIGTLCVDHNVLVGGALGATFYQIASRNELYNDKIDFEEVLPNEELKAGEPYIFKSTTGRIDLFYGATEADAPVEVRGMIGSFVDAHVDITSENMSDILYIAKNKLWNCEDLVGSYLEVIENRAYIVMSDVPTYADYQAAQTSNPAPRRRVTLGKDAEQVVTGVENLNASEQPVKLLINGQIFILRGEKMFDATGRLVK